MSAAPKRIQTPASGKLSQEVAGGGVSAFHVAGTPQPRFRFDGFAELEIYSVEECGDLRVYATRGGVDVDVTDVMDPAHLAEHFAQHRMALRQAKERGYVFRS